MKTSVDVCVIGGGPAGLAAAISARKNGAQRVLIIERDNRLGGILNQCIHNGFGLTFFKTELTGPEYALRFIDELKKTDIEVLTDTMVLSVSPEPRRNIVFASSPNGYHEITAVSVVLAMGCRERSRGAIAIPGDRPSGIFTAGTAQKYVNMDGFMVGRRVLILGSGDIGLIMARRMTLEGARVLGCVELMPHSSGLNRNIVQCLNDFDIPLYLSHTVTDIKGKTRLEQVTVSKVDENKSPISGTEMIFDCDTLLLSVGLIPENEITRGMGIKMNDKTNGAVVTRDCQTSCPGVFACGNVLHVHDLVDNVTAQSNIAGKAAAEFVLDTHKGDCEMAACESDASPVAEASPDIEALKENEFICVVCPKGCKLSVCTSNGEITVTGNICKRGEAYAKSELQNPTRVLTSTVKIKALHDKRLPVKSSVPIPKSKLFEAMKLINTVELVAPVKCGEVIIPNILCTNADIIATGNAE